MIRKVFYIDNISCCHESTNNPCPGDLYYVVSPPLIDVLLRLNVKPRDVLTPLSLLPHYESYTDVFTYYATLEESIVDQKSYINWLLCNQALLIQFLVCILNVYYHDEEFVIITFRPSIHLDQRLNSGLPVSIYYYLREYVCKYLCHLSDNTRLSVHIYFPTKHIIKSIARRIIPFMLSFKPIYNILGINEFKNIPLILGTGVPTNKIDEIKKEHTHFILFKPASEFSFKDLFRNTIYFRDDVTTHELASWIRIIGQKIPDEFPLSRNTHLTKPFISSPYPDNITPSINSIIGSLSMYYLSVLRSSYKVYLSDHVNLFTFSFLSAIKIAPIAYQLIAHGGDRRSPIFAQLTFNNLLLSDYVTSKISTVRTQAQTKTIILKSNTPLVVVSYASFKRIGFKIKPQHLYRVNQLLMQLIKSPSGSLCNWTIYVAKKNNSESILSNIDLVPALHNSAIISTQCILSQFPSAIIIAVGQIGTAHIQLVKAGHHILYFGDRPDQSPIEMNQYKYTCAPDGSLQLEAYISVENKTKPGEFLYSSL